MECGLPLDAESQHRRQELWHVLPLAGLSTFYLNCQFYGSLGIAVVDTPTEIPKDPILS